MDLIFELFTNADHFLITLATDYGWLVYVAMFLIFFCETGIVVLAFLPGDSLLFVSGTVAAAGTMSPWGLMLAVILGACLGNTLGFHTGRWLGNKIYDGSVSWINAEKLAKIKGMEDEFRLLKKVEQLTPEVFAEKKGSAKDICANVDLYSGFVYRMLGLPEELFTPLFATARISGWAAHRIEEYSTCSRIMRPAYKSVVRNRPYIPLEERM